MLKRYASEEMQELWTEESKFWYWLQVEIAVLQARVKLGRLRPEAFDAISVHAKINVERIHELEQVYEHDMIAFVEAVQETLEAAGVGQYKNELHKGLTSYDVEDPALILMLRQAVRLIIKDLEQLRSALAERKQEHRRTLMIARTHGQYAEPTTFGHLLAVFESAISRSIRRIYIMLDTELKEGRLSGTVGIYAGTDPELEKEALDLLELFPA
ncbi:MAG: lyase family protein, partial [bacterium]|nr:lyase family protein [bacterium]